LEIKKSIRSSHTLDIEKTYELSALIDVDSFFYVITDADQEQVTIIDHTPIKKGDKELQLTPNLKLKSAKIAIANSLYTLIPADQYTPETLKDYVHQVMLPFSRDLYVYQSDHIPSAELYICYAIPKDLYKYCFTLPAIPILYHQVGALLTQVNRKSSRTIIHISRHADNIIIFVIVKGQVKLANTFKSDSPITTLYYITLVHQSLGIGKENLDLEFSGAFIPKDETDRLVSKYFSNIKYSPASIKLDGQLIEHSSVYFPLQSVSLCA